MTGAGKETKCVAFDCGNSSVRVVAGIFNGESIKTQVISQVDNQAIEVNGLYYWDILNIYNELQKGLQQAYHELGEIDSVGICTWGVDFGLLDKRGYLLGNPLSYRNTLGQESVANLTEKEKVFMFKESGIQTNRINSLYQLVGFRKAFPELFGLAEHLLTIPDLLAYMFTGTIGTEYTIASTTQVLDVNKSDYSKGIIEHFALPAKIFQPLFEHGTSYGCLRDNLMEVLKIEKKLPFICVPSHDTAAAVAAIPVIDEEFLFISSGTWSLIGTELPKPVIDDRVYDLFFANEGGAFGTVTMLKNSIGLYIIQEVRKELAREGKSYTWDEIVGLAQQCDKAPLINPNHDLFFNPSSMIKAIRDYVERTGQGSDISVPAIIRCVYESLAYSYRYAIEQIEQITGKQYATIHIVGGGSKNGFLNQLTADFTGKKVLAGPVEATSLGNLGVQLKYHYADLDFKAIRGIMSKSVDVKSFTPQAKESSTERFQLFTSLLTKS